MKKHPLLNISFRTLFDWCKNLRTPYESCGIYLRRSSPLNLPFAALPLPSVLMMYCKLQFNLRFH